MKFSSKSPTSVLILPCEGVSHYPSDQVPQSSTHELHRAGLSEARSYIAPVKLGATMRAGGLGVVEHVGSAVRNLKAGDQVRCTPGFTEYAVLPASTCQKAVVPEGAAISDFLGVIGMVGQTAYWGLLDVGKIQAGQTVVVSGAAGAVGMIVSFNTFYLLQ